MPGKRLTLQAKAQQEREAALVVLSISDLDGDSGRAERTLGKTPTGVEDIVPDAAEDTDVSDARFGSRLQMHNTLRAGAVETCMEPICRLLALDQTAFNCRYLESRCKRPASTDLNIGVLRRLCQWLDSHP